MTVGDVLDGLLASMGLYIKNPELSDSTNFDIKQIKHFINEAGADIVARAEWAKLTTYATAVDEWTLPDDFQELVESGAVTTSTGVPVRVIISPEQWELITNRPGTSLYCHLRNGVLAFSHAGTYKIRYLSKNWLEGKSKATQNGDVLLIPQSLVAKSALWRWRRQKGLPYDDYAAEFEADMSVYLKADRGAA